LAEPYRKTAFQNALKNTPKVICFWCNGKNLIIKGFYFDGLVMDQGDILMYRCPHCTKYFVSNFMTQESHGLTKEALNTMKFRIKDGQKRKTLYY